MLYVVPGVYPSAGISVVILSVTVVAVPPWHCVQVAPPSAGPPLAGEGDPVGCELRLPRLKTPTSVKPVKNNSLDFLI